MDWRDVPIPALMKKLPRGKNGMPAPWISETDKDGVPIFSINDEIKRQQCYAKDLCGICGHKLMRFRWFIGGPHAAFHPQGAYLDPPMHEACMTYAMQVCPNMAAKEYSKLVARKKAEQIGYPQEMLSNGPQASRVEIFTNIKCDGMRLQRGDIARDVPGAMFEVPGIVSASPKRPYRQIQLWRHGEMLDDITDRDEIAALTAKMTDWALASEKAAVERGEAVVREMGHG